MKKYWSLIQKSYGIYANITLILRQCQVQLVSLYANQFGV